MQQLQDLKRWFEALPSAARWVLFPLAVVLLNAIVVGIICVILGTTDALSLSNALFYDAALVMLAALILYFASRQQSRPSLKELTSGRSPQELAQARPRRPDPLPFYATTLFLAGVLLFGFSIVVTYAAGLA